LDKLYELAQTGNVDTAQLVVSLLKKLAPEIGSDALKARLAEL